MNASEQEYVEGLRVENKMLLAENNMLRKEFQEYQDGVTMADLDETTDEAVSAIKSCVKEHNERLIRMVKGCAIIVGCMIAVCAAVVGGV